MNGASVKQSTASIEAHDSLCLAGQPHQTMPSFSRLLSVPPALGPRGAAPPGTHGATEGRVGGGRGRGGGGRRNCNI